MAANARNNLLTLCGNRLTVRFPLSPLRRFRHSEQSTEDSPELALLLSKFSQQPPRPLTLNKLLSFGSPLTPESLLESASYVLSELPRRLVGRIRALEALPFIVTTNPFLSRILKAYRVSFQALATHPQVQNLQQNWKFSQRLEGLVVDHSNDIPNLAKGFQECSRYMTDADISSFLDHAIRTRIGVRLLAEQHITLSRALQEAPQTPLYDLGVVDMSCSAAQMVRLCSKFVTDLCDATLGVSPNLVLEGDVQTTFAYVPVHLEFALTELLKNAYRATVEHHRLNGASSRQSLPPIIVTIVPSPGATARTHFLSIRMRDQGGGISPANLRHIFSYAFTTAGRMSPTGHVEDNDGGSPYAAQATNGMATMGGEDGSSGSLFHEITGKGLQTGIGTLSGLGYGLPLAKLYAAYFGGDLQLVSLYGHGTDVFLKLRCLHQEDNSVIL